MNHDTDIHVGLNSQCGICTEHLAVHDRCIALSGNRDSTTHAGLTHLFAFPKISSTLTLINEHRACRQYVGCQTCAKSPEFAPMHYECYSIFSQSCSGLSEADTLDRLWVLAAWTRPWRNANPFLLQKSRYMLRGQDKAALVDACTVAGIPQIADLPEELVQLICQSSRHALLWRCTAAITLARQITTLEPSSHDTLPLSDILSWARGGQLFKRAQSALVSPVIRIAVDAFGIASVEGLECAPAYDGNCSLSVAYVFVSGKARNDIRVIMKYGCLRLVLPHDKPSLPIWNTPSLPDLSSSVSLGQNFLSSWASYHVVEMDRVQGLTLFMHDGRIFGVHAHHLGGPTAMEAYERFPAHSRHQIVWVHLPLPRGDRLLILAEREYRGQSSILLARTRLAGDVFLGMPGAETEGDFGLARAPITLVYMDPGDGLSVPYFSALSLGTDDEVNDEEPKRFPSIPHNPLPRGRSPYFSWAPLADVASVCTFSDAITGFCKGIHFRYDSGAERAVGQCRPCIDPFEVVVDPGYVSAQAVMTYGSRQNELRQVKVNFREDVDVEESWDCYPMEGLVYFWFTHDTACVNVLS